MGSGAILTGGEYLGEGDGDLDGCCGSADGPGPHTDHVWPSASAVSTIRGDGRHSKFAHLAITQNPLSSAFGLELLVYLRKDNVRSYLYIFFRRLLKFCCSLCG